MRRVWQVIALCCALGPLRAEEPAGFTWTSIKVGAGFFSTELTMMDGEREEYATNLANVAASRVADAKASPASLEQARKMISLALQLSPRNKRALVVNFQLSQGTLPEKAAGDFSAETLAKLLHTRARLLKKTGGEENEIAGRMFTQLAAQLDPRNEDAVYASELDRLDHGGIDWEMLSKPEHP